MTTLFEQEPAEPDIGKEVEQEEPVEAVEATEEAPKDEVKEEVPVVPEKPPKGFVPQQALHEERERRKEYQRQVAQVQQEAAQRQALLESRFQQIQEAIAAQSAPKAPDYDSDPLGNVKHTLDSTQAELKKLREHQEQEYKRQYEDYQRQQYAAKVAQAVTQAESEYVQENPDYLDAVKHLKTIRAQQLEALGMDPNSIMSYVQNEAFQVAEAALQRGQSPAEVAFKMAVASGWKKQEVKPDAETKIETLQKGSKAAQSLGSGGVPKGNLSIQALAEMNDSEFKEAIKSGAWEKLGLGG